MDLLKLFGRVATESMFSVLECDKKSKWWVYDLFLKLFVKVFVVFCF